MKKQLITLVMALLCVCAAWGQVKTETIHVAGNCGTCQKHIETAARKAGAQKAEWNKKTKVLTVTYDQATTSNEAIQKKVAAAGYDTELFVGDERAYKALDECCQYDDKKSTAKAK